ncbi:MAG: sodium:proton antiporter [Planctomycetaceae bacterium]|nr:sodium:proton antiporter [Planctomycetaceae bacterium]
MEQPHNTIESQLLLRSQGLFATGAILIALGAWLVYATLLAAPAGEGAHHPPATHETSDHAHPDPSPAEKSADETHGHEEEAATVPAWYSVLPFVALLLCIAILPLSRRTEHWWEKNWNRFLVAAGLGVVTLAYFAFLFHHGVHDHVTGGHSEPGLQAAFTVLKNALLAEYIPFITLLFSLYVITGGIVIEGRLAGKPFTNMSIIGVGALLASFVGTTGAAMLLIRPLLTANARREYVAHTVLFFIFAVCNTGGCLLPIGDPPLFLGFLRGVDFLWTLNLWQPWLFTNSLILIVYFVYDTIISRKEKTDAFAPSRQDGPLLSMQGKLNLIWLMGVIGCVATLDPSKPFPGTDWHAPLYFREFLMFLLTFCSLVTTTCEVRLKNTFNYDAILEVAALFSGIFVCMQAPVMILNVYGKHLGFESPAAFFWGTGFLSSFLDNAPTYVVFFETARTMEPMGPLVAGVTESFLVAISLGAVFMGSMTYIGNGPNFMVKAIAEKNNIRMPSFFGYMLYSFTILLPIFLLMTLIFL